MKKVAIILFVLALLIPSAVKAEWFEKYNKLDYAMHGTMIALTVIDWGQTLYIADHPDRYYEKANEFMSDHPSRGDVNTFFISNLIITSFVSYALPRPWRNVFQGWRIIVHGRYSLHNRHLGVGITF